MKESKNGKNEKKILRLVTPSMSPPGFVLTSFKVSLKHSFFCHFSSFSYERGKKMRIKKNRKQQKIILNNFWFGIALKSFSKYTSKDRQERQRKRIKGKRERQERQRKRIKGKRERPTTIVTDQTNMSFSYKRSWGYFLS